MIKLITFDIGGTIIKSEKSVSRYELLKKYLDLSEEEYKEAFYISKEPLASLFSSHTKIMDDEQKAHINRILNSEKNKVFNEKMINLIEKLHNMGYKIATISNVNYYLYTSLANSKVEKFIDKEFYSFEIGDFKPHLNAFLYIQNYYNLKPEETLHIGDSKVSDYYGAINAGWNAILVDNNLNINDYLDIIGQM